MRNKTLGVGILAMGMVISVGGSSAEARSLTKTLDTLFGTDGIALDVRPVNPMFPPHTAHFRSASLQALGLLAGQLSSQAADFPALSSVPGFTYSYNEKLQVFEPTPGAFGPIFVERPESLGRGKFNVGLSYAYLNFSQLDGQDLDKQSFTLHHNDCCGGPNTPNSPAFENDSIDVAFEKFKLESHVISLFATYGVTDRVDVNVLLPLIDTSLRVRARAHINNTTNPIHFFDNDAKTLDSTRSTSADHFGVGDFQLRTKLRLDEVGGVRLATGLLLRFPTGSQDDFQGFGAFTVEPFATAATDVSSVNLHTSLGFQVDPEEASRSRVRYAGGAAWQAMERVALILDVVGSSNLTEESVTFPVPQFDQNGNQVGTDRVRQKFRTSVVDLAPGVKVNVFGSAFAFFTAFVPLNNDGLRADFIPTGGVEMSF